MTTSKVKWSIDQKNYRAAFLAAWDVFQRVKDSGKRYILEIRPETRSDRANRRLHAMLGTLAMHAEYQGRKLDIDAWKHLMCSGHMLATGEPDFVTGLEGELINLRESTAKMSGARISSLMEYISAYAVSIGIDLGE